MNKCITILLSFLIYTSTVYAQSSQIDLANQYYQQGDGEKALEIYLELIDNKNSSKLIHHNYLAILLEQKNYVSAEEFLIKQVKRFSSNYYYQVDLIGVYITIGQLEKSEQQFIKLLKHVFKQEYQVRNISNYLRSKQLYDYAIQLLLEGRSQFKDSKKYAIDLANLYLYINDVDKMVDEYVVYLSDNKNSIVYVQNSLQLILKDEKSYHRLELILIDRIQKNAKVYEYNELLIWLYLQEQNFEKAFIQAKAIDKRLKKEGEQLQKIADIALENKSYQDAIKIYAYIIKTYPDSYLYSYARRNSIRAREEKIKSTYPVDLDEISILIKQYNELIGELGIMDYTLDALRAKALLHAFYLQEMDSAITILTRVINESHVKDNLKAYCKLDLGDIYLYKLEPWESTLLYMQAEKEMKDQPVAYEAKLKSAKLSYYTGDFILAKAHLDVLKEATTREIANDAMALSMLIQDNTALDTSEIAMQTYANIELILYRQQIDTALILLEKMLTDFPAHPLSDEIYWLQATTYREIGKFDRALIKLEKIITDYPEDILADDAMFTKGVILEESKGENLLAQEVYRSFLITYPGSLYVEEARKRFRKLRGDFN